MKRSLYVFAVLAIPAILLAGTYSITTTTAQDTRLEKARVRTNKATCGALSLPPTCTQAQARAKDSAASIYSDVADFLDRYVIHNYTDSLKTADTSDDQQQFCSFWGAATLAQKNQICADSALPNGCELCQ
jgi:hypothetical protein